AYDLVAEMQQRIAHIDQARPNGDHVIVAGRGFVAAAHVYDGDVRAVLLLHFAIGEAELAQHFHPAHLKPDDEVGVIDHAHLVRLRIAHPKLGLVHLRFGGHALRLPVFGFQPDTHPTGDHGPTSTARPAAQRTALALQPCPYFFSAG